MSVRATGVIASVKRLMNDRNGNPKYIVQLASGLVYRTEPSAQVNYGIQAEALVDKPVVLTINQAGHIIGIEETS